nr:phosphotransferase [Acidobacteriota bacterium]
PERIAALKIKRHNAKAVGVRRIHDRTDAYVAEVTLSDGAKKREVIVRQPCADDLHEEAIPPVERARHEFEVISTLSQTFAAGEGEQTSSGTRYAVPKLVMFDEPNAAIVTERADGRSLAGIVAGAVKPSRVTSGMRKAGTWLRLMQQHTRGADDGRHILTAVVLLALRDLDLAAAADREIAAMHGKIKDRLQELESRRAEQKFPVVGHHGDYRLDNIFIGEKRVDVTSFGAFREGLPLEDVAQFLIDLELRSAIRRGRRATLRDAFLEGYGAKMTDADREALLLFSITKALHMLSHRGHESRRTHAALRKIIRRSLS